MEEVVDAHLDATRHQLLETVIDHLRYLDYEFEQSQAELDPKTFGSRCYVVQETMKEISRLDSLVEVEFDLYYQRISIADAHITHAIKDADSMQSAARRIEFGLSLVYRELEAMKGQLKMDIEHGII